MSRLTLLPALYLLVLLACSESVDIPALVDQAVEATERTDQLRADRDAALDAFTYAWEKVEGGPQYTLLALERVADQIEYQGETIRAARMRQEALEEFQAHPLVRDATRKSDKYRELDGLFVQANRELAQLLGQVQDAGASDLYRERILAAVP